MAASIELIDFFRKRLLESHALEETQKQNILNRIDELDEERIGKILELLVKYEKILEEDGRRHVEKSERDKEIEALQKNVDSLM